MTREPDTDRAIADDAARDRAVTGDDAIGGRHLSAQRPSFTAGVITGGIIGAVLALAFAPRAGAHLRQVVASSTKDLDSAISNRRQDAAAHAVQAIGPFSHRAAASGVAVAVANDVAGSANSVKS
jgi:gas vesicle protein